MEYKKGISLILLIATIVLVLILVATITVTVGNSLDNSRIVAFAEDLRSVEEASILYYEQNDLFPTFEEEKAYSKAEIMNMVKAKNKAILNEELSLNNDNVENDNLGTFYKIDLAKLNVEQTKRGLMQDENGKKLETDLFVLAYPSMNVYYLEGLEAKNTVYFSLSDKISKVVKVSPKIIRNNVGETANMTAKRNLKTWTNKLDIVIEATMELNEELYISIEEGIKHKLETNRGFNTFYFSDSFDKVEKDANGQKIDSGITIEEINNFNQISQANKKMTITKEKRGAILGKIDIDLSNYDTDLPVKTTNSNVISNEYNNIVTFKVEDATSGIKDVKYEYLRKFDENAVANLYYDGVTEYESSYIYSRGKSAKILNDGLVEIEVPKDIEGIQIRIFDKAGNASNIINQNTTTPIYIGINEINPTKNSVTLNNVIKTNDKTVNFATIQISADDKNYTNEQQLNLVNEDNYLYRSTIECENLVDIDENIYVKLNVNYGNNNTEVRIKKIYLYDQIEKIGEGTREEEKSAYDRPYVPSEFSYLTGSVQTGYVIKDRINGNEFVWVPVKDISEFKRGVIGDTTSLTNIIEENNDINNKIGTSVAKHGGFYIGRYETRYDGEIEFDENNIGTCLKGDLKPVINSVSNIWNYISQEYASEISSSMYTGKTKSTLMNSYAYDTTLNWIISSGSKTQEEINIDSTNWGNYLNSNISGVTAYLPLNGIVANNIWNIEENKEKLSGEALLIKSLSSDYTKVNNIYDLAGNVYEWTTEKNGNNITGRGGRFDINGSEKPASYRFYDVKNNTNNKDVGFRVILYW